MRRRLCGLMVLAGMIFFSAGHAAEDAPPLPIFSLNSQVQHPTVQELSGLATRPLRLLVERNNKTHGAQLMQAFALGVSAGDELKIELAPPAEGMRVTLYKIFREPKGSRYFSMPVTVFSGEPLSVYSEKVVPFREEIFIAVYEKTGSAEKKNAHIRYFEERARKLVIASFRTNLMLSSLKFKMKDFADEDARGFFVESAQSLVDRLIEPQRIYMFRFWRADSGASSDVIIPVEKTGE